MTLSKRTIYLLLLALALTQSACLKTRAQIKEGQDQSAESDGAPAPSVPMKGSYEVEEMKNEITRLSGKVEELDHSSKTQNVDELKGYMTRLDARVADLEKNQLLVMQEVKDLKDKAAAAPPPRETSAAPSDLMTEGNQLLSEKKCDEAAEKFRAVLAKNPKGKQGADASFGLGEAEYCQKNYKKAIVAYSKVQELSKKSPKVPASLYRIGLSFQHLNMNTEAKGFFSDLIENYPNSPEAKKARGKVKE